MIRPRTSMLVAFTLSLGACPNDQLLVSHGETADGDGGYAGPGSIGVSETADGAVVPATGVDPTNAGGTTGANGTVNGGATVPPSPGAGGQVIDAGGVMTGMGGTVVATGTGGSSGAVSTGTGGTPVSGLGPCDLYAAASPPTPCVAAYSMVRVLAKAYAGPLYQVRSGSSSSNTGTGGMIKDIGATLDGFADVASQDAFCSDSTCTVSLLYDQSGNGNHLRVAPKGRIDGGEAAAQDDFESSATRGAINVAGHKVYSLYMNSRQGYRLTRVGQGMPVGNSDQGVYMLADGTHSGSACCWEFGSASPDPMKVGLSNALFLGTAFWGKGAGAGPWFMGDFEDGVWAGGSGDRSAVNSDNPSMKSPFAFGTLKTSSGQWAIRVADLQTASDLTTAYDGASPKAWANDGGIILGISTDNSNSSFGTFFEGAITAGRPSNDTDRAVLKNVQAVGYGN